FTTVNGFPNCYWGWGPEAMELSHRLRLRGFRMERRDGTYIPLPHKHAGFSAPQVWNDVGRRTNELFRTREPNFATLIEKDGVNTLKFQLLEKKSRWRCPQRRPCRTSFTTSWISASRNQARSET
ncbi:MAG: galactosyltransferase-related protein, partial [Pseudolabrys sp.]